MQHFLYLAHLSISQHGFGLGVLRVKRSVDADSGYSGYRSRVVVFLEAAQTLVPHKVERLGQLDVTVPASQLAIHLSHKFDGLCEKGQALVSRVQVAELEKVKDPLVQVTQKFV